MIYFARIDIGEISGQYLKARMISVIKIGSSIEVETRIKAHQNYFKKPVTLLATMPGGRREERLLHDRFSHIRVPSPGPTGRLEWFYPVHELMEFIEILVLRS